MVTVAAIDTARGVNNGGASSTKFAIAIGIGIPLAAIAFAMLVGGYLWGRSEDDTPGATGKYVTMQKEFLMGVSPILNCQL
jgi:hypothetical protein